MNNSKVRRIDDVMMIKLDARTWDIECSSIWEKILYVEYCSWSGKSAVDLSINTIARKLAVSMPEYSERTIYNHIKAARLSLIEKGVIQELDKKGFRNTKLIALADTYKTRMLRMFANKYGKIRAKLYQIKQEEKDDNADTY